MNSISKVNSQLQFNKMNRLTFKKFKGSVFPIVDLESLTITAIFMKDNSIMIQKMDGESTSTPQDRDIADSFKMTKFKVMEGIFSFPEPNMKEIGAVG